METGDILAGRYQLLEQLGEGRIGEVFRASDKETGTQVAVKLPHPWHASNPEFAARFRRELLTGMRLAHPAIVRCLDTGEHKNVPFLVMELVGGLPIEQWFDSTGRDFEALAEVLDQTLDALAYAHAHRVIHRELKPANILVVAGPQPRLLDFGLAGRLEDQLRGDARDRDLGLAYLSPEQGVGERGDERSDLYSFGAVLYRLVAGRPVFEASTAPELLLAHLNEAPVPLSSLRTSVPIWFDRLVQRLLAKHPDRRPQSATEVQSWIRRRRLPARPAPVQRPEPLLGREEELKKLSTSLKALEKGKGSIFRFSGPGGQGKTRLAEEVLQLASQKGYACLSVRPPAGEDLHQGLILRALGKGYGTVIERLEERTVDTPLVLLLDSFHRADPVVAALLEELVGSIRGLPILLMVAERTQEIRHEATRLALDRVKNRFSLEGLDKDTCARLMEDKLWATPPPEAVSWLHRLTEGNPRYLRILLDQLEGSNLSVVGGMAQWNQPPSHETPRSLEDLLKRNLEREGQETAELLGIAACLGEWFEFNLLKALVLLEESVLEATLEKLVRIGYLREEWESGVVAYHFAHESLWEVARVRVNERRERRLHLLAAAFLERSGHCRPERLAGHYERCGDFPRAMLKLTQALADSLEREDFGEARYWFKRCQSLGQEQESLAADRIFPAPWLNFGWAGLAEDTGLRHFLAAQWALLGRGEEALWQLQIVLEQGLEDDPHRLVENHLLRVALHLRNLGVSRQEAWDSLRMAMSVANDQRLADRLALGAAMRGSLESLPEESLLGAE